MVQGSLVGESSSLKKIKRRICINPRNTLRQKWGEHVHPSPFRSDAPVGPCSVATLLNPAVLLEIIMRADLRLTSSRISVVTLVTSRICTQYKYTIHNASPLQSEIHRRC